jgi:AraC-like DNA-binding protein
MPRATALALLSKGMTAGLGDAQRGRLERSCDARDWIRAGVSRPGLERVEASFACHAFAPHRHDTYAIGITLQGVQAFDYRGAARRSTSGQVFVLHPDELHDGHAGSEAGFRYRILYVDPTLIGDALGGPCALPFVRDAVSGDRRLLAAIAPALADLDLPLEDLRHDQIVADLAQALAEGDRSVPRKPPSRIDRRAALCARDYLAAGFERTVRSCELEAVTGVDRYALARHFRSCFGTSPYRYLVMRRLDRARALIAAGSPLCEAALAAGFADQSHLSRHFKRAYGVTPGRWAALALDRLPHHAERAALAFQQGKGLK